jgi:hypothetical protein
MIWIDLNFLFSEPMWLVSVQTNVVYGLYGQVVRATPRSERTTSVDVLQVYLPDVSGYVLFAWRLSGAEDRERWLNE